MTEKKRHQEPKAAVRTPNTRPSREKKPVLVTAEDVLIGQTIAATVKRIGINGEGVAYYKKKAVFIDGALPGETVKAKITRIEPSFLYASLIEVQKKSPHRIVPECPVYEACGGCQLLHMNYEGQLQAKEEIVRESFARYAGIARLPLRPIAGMDNPWGYRNKAQLQAGAIGNKMVTGLYSAGTHKLVDISGCRIHHPGINRVIDGVKDIVNRLSIPIYSERKKTGVIRTIVARAAFQSNRIQLTFITAAERLPHSTELVAMIRERLPQVVSISQNINEKQTPLIFGDKTIHLWGEPHLNETLEHLKYSLSPRAFFQLNPQQTVKLYNYVKEAAALSGGETVVDAYCGTGTISLWLAPYAKQVRGIEIIPEAVKDARRNAEHNGIDNVSFHIGKAEQILPEWAKQGIRPDVIVVDPPRTGCDPKLLQAIIRTKPKRFVYVSCNPATLAKDCKVLLAGGFQLEWVQPVDMFPQTAHVECVVSTYRVDK